MGGSKAKSRCRGVHSATEPSCPSFGRPSAPTFGPPPQGRLAPGSAQCDCCASDWHISSSAKPIPTISACKAARRGPLRDSACRRSRDAVAAHVNASWRAARMHGLHLELTRLRPSSVGRRQARSRRRISEGKKPLSRIARRHWRGRHTAMRKAAREVILAGGAFNTPADSDVVWRWSTGPARCLRNQGGGPAGGGRSKSAGPL